MKKLKQFFRNIFAALKNERAIRVYVTIFHAGMVVLLFLVAFKARTIYDDIEKIKIQTKKINESSHHCNCCKP